MDTSSVLAFGFVTERARELDDELVVPKSSGMSVKLRSAYSW